jgi:hypothetical protein
VTDASPATSAVERSDTCAAILTPVEARALGLSRGDVLRLVRQGTWQRIAGGYRTRPESELRPVDRWRATLVAVGGHAVISHTTAAKAYGWDLLDPDDQVHVTVLRNRSRVSVPCVQVHRRALPSESTQRMDPLVVTAPVRTLLDLAASLSHRAGVVAADSALRQHHVTHGELIAGLVSSRRWDQHPRMHEVIVACDAQSGSMPETVARLAFASAGLPAPVSQLRIRFPSGALIAVVDFAWEEQRVVVEIDGRQYHSDEDAFQNDRLRQNGLVRAGWLVLRFTAADVLRRPAWVAEQVRVVLELQSRGR